MSDLIPVAKGDDYHEVHPTCLAAHKAAGYVECERREVVKDADEVARLAQIEAEAARLESERIAAAEAQVSADKAAADEAEGDRLAKVEADRVESERLAAVNKAATEKNPRKTKHPKSEA